MKYFNGVGKIVCSHEGDLEAIESVSYGCRIYYISIDVEGKPMQKSEIVEGLQKVTIKTKPQSEEQGATLKLPKDSFESVRFKAWSPLRCKYDGDELECKEEYEED